MRRWWLLAGAALAFLLCLPLMMVVGLGGMANVAAACSPQPPSVKLTGVSAVQSANAVTIAAAGSQMVVPPAAVVIALAVGVTESGLRNLANTTVPASLLLPHQGVGSDHDSVGVFQQRPNWGTLAARMDVFQSAGKFYTRLLAVPGWQSMPLTVAAQAVQGSANPGAYAQAETLARSLAAQLVGTALGGVCGTQPTATGAAAVAIAHAKLALGTMYQFGGSCTDPLSPDPALHCDCSSLVQQAWLAAGVHLPRTSELQYQASNVHLIAGASPTNLTNVPPGALLFYALGEQIAGLPGHIALYLGGGKLIEASQKGQPVAIRPVYQQTWVAAGMVA